MCNIYIYDIKHKMVKRYCVDETACKLREDGWFVVKEGNRTLLFNKDDISSIEIEPSEYDES